MVFISIYDIIQATRDTEVDKIPYHYLLREDDNIKYECTYVCVCAHTYSKLYININMSW